MSHRTTITLTDEQYERLREEATRRGITLAELVRLAVDRAYGTAGADEVGRALAESFGAWGKAGPDGAAYVEDLRGGMGQRLAS